MLNERVFVVCHAKYHWIAGNRYFESQEEAGEFLYAMQDLLEGQKFNIVVLTKITIED